MPHDRVDLFRSKPGTESEARKLRSDEIIVAELTRVLTSHPGGLRRWSVMRAIRKEREHAGQDIPQNFEAEVERMFRRFCANVDAVRRGRGAMNDAPFFRPSEKAGEVWAILLDRAWSSCELAEAI
jgi:hypothetical protein